MNGMMRLLALVFCLAGMVLALYSIYSAVTGDVGAVMVCLPVAGVSYFVAQGLATMID